MATNNNLNQTSDSKAYLYFYSCFLGAVFLSYHTSALDYTLTPRFVFVILILSCFFLWFALSKTSLPYHNTLVLTGIVFLCWHALSINWSINKAESVFSTARYLVGLTSTILTLHLLCTSAQAESLILKTITIITGIALCLAVYQLLQSPLSGYKNPYHIESVSGHKNLFASILFGLTFFMLHAFRSFERSWKWIVACCLIGCVFFIIILQTRAVWMGSCVAIFVFIIFSLKHWKSILLNIFKQAYFIAGILLLFGIALSILISNNPAQFIDRLNIANYTSSPAGAERLVIWRKTFELIRQHPVAGVGAGNWQITFPGIGLDGLPNIEFNHITFQRPHNDLIWIWSELGTIGFLIYVLIQGLIVYRVFRHVRGPHSDLKVILYFAAYGGLMTISFFDFPKERIEHIVLQATIVAMIWYYISHQGELLKQRWYQRTVSIGFSVLLLSSFVIGCIRWQGEHVTKKMYAARENKNYEKVIRLCDKAYSGYYSLDPTSVPLYWYRGSANFSLGNMRESLNDFLLAEKDAPFNQYVLNNLGSAYEMNGNSNLARTYYLKALKISPHMDDARLNLAAISYNEQNYKESLQWVESTVGNSERKDSYLKILKQKLK